jgi:glucan phosphoethanolaminetransferase (alkaline phosphatase superfamily)
VSTTSPEISRPITFRLSPSQVIWSVSILALYLIVGTYFAVVYFLFPVFSTPARALACAPAIALASAASSYLRKLYKAGITLRIDATNATWSERFGSQLYVMGRPLMAALLALVGTMALIVNFYGTAPQGTEPTDGIVHIASLIGFSIGALSSKALKEVEESGRVPVS